MAEQVPAQFDLVARMTRTDRYVGARIRACRANAGLSLQQLGSRIGVSAPQLHKYELGTNRVTVGRLHLLAIALGVDIGWLLDGIGGFDAGRSERLSTEHGARLSDPHLPDHRS
jgi:transcriptional regulator with XRE-family HTH domain